MNTKVYQNNRATEIALAEINDKLQGIREAEKNINRLFDMVKDLHHIVTSSNLVIDSIAQKVDVIQDHVEKISANTQEAKDLFISAKEVC